MTEPKRKRPRRGKPVKQISVALQGGGAHGAFTWGALDRLLEEEDIEIGGISGTSAGALNGAALKAGLTKGGREAAKACLDALWARVGAVETPEVNHWMAGIPTAPLVQAIEMSPVYAAADWMSRLFSPYSLGPFYRNPLIPIVEAFDFDEVCSCDGPALFICATRVRTGKIRIFTGEHITVEAILASACLPTMFQAVEIDDPETGRREAYWDGGYSGNPALYPLFPDYLPDDIVIININPLERDDLPVTPQQIQNRINEISFNSSLLRELRAIAFVQRLQSAGRLTMDEKARVLVHMIADDDLMNELSEATKMVPNAVLLSRLKEAGRAAAGRFLEAHKDDLNERSSIDLLKMYS